MFWIAQLFVLILCFISVLGIPSWDGGFGTQPTTSIGSLVPGAGCLEALGPVSHEQYRPKYLSVTAPRGEASYLADVTHSLTRLPRCPRECGDIREPFPAALLCEQKPALAGHEPDVHIASKPPERYCDASGTAEASIRR